MSERRTAMTDLVMGNVVELAFAVITVVVIRRVMKPDFTLMLRMRTAQTVKRFAQTQADQWQKLADNAATAYQKARI